MVQSVEIFSDDSSIVCYSDMGRNRIRIKRSGGVIFEIIIHQIE